MKNDTNAPGAVQQWDRPLTPAQRVVMETLYDVATHEGGTILLKNRYHSAAHALGKRGWILKHDGAWFRPRYAITPAGKAEWERSNNPLVP